MTKKRWLLAIGTALIVLAAITWIFRDNIERRFFAPTPSVIEEVEEVSQTEVIAENLTIPWEAVFLPNGEILVTERSGALKQIGENGQTFTIEGVAHQGEGGLLGMALHPQFEQNHYLYLYLTTAVEGGLTNRVERYQLDNDQLVGRQEIITGIPGAAIHDGGRIAFGPDELLYITTGDAGNESSAQDLNSLAGKILRLNADGTIPDDNPFGNAIYSYGHRNPQGLAWDDEGQLWATEHGRSGLSSGFDELNLIKKGANYGWPLIEGDARRSGMEAPVIHSGSNETWAPAGLVFKDGQLWWAGLRGESLYQASVNGAMATELKAHYREQFGRLRAVSVGPDGSLYVTTSNTDGRGDEQPGDDKIIKLGQ